jgi:hypothetical protein
VPIPTYGRRSVAKYTGSITSRMRADIALQTSLFFEGIELFLEDGTDVGDLWASRMFGKEGRRARVGRDDERVSRQSVVICWGDGDAKVPKESVA